MTGNATIRYTNTAVLSVRAVDAPIVVTSAEFDDAARRNVRAGRACAPGCWRGWPASASGAGGRTTSRFADGAAMAGAKAMAEAGVDPSQIGLLINTSVSRAHLEPSTAVAVHHALGLPTSCLNFDLANACLGFVNGMQLAGRR